MVNTAHKEENIVNELVYYNHDKFNNTRLTLVIRKFQRKYFLYRGQCAPLYLGKETSQKQIMEIYDLLHYTDFKEEE